MKLETSDDMLDFLSAAGRPNLFRHDDGTWSASLELPAPTGCEAKIRSGFEHPTHRSALGKLCELLTELRDAQGAPARTADILQLPGRR